MSDPYHHQTNEACHHNFKVNLGVALTNALANGMSAQDVVDALNERIEVLKERYHLQSTN